MEGQKNPINKLADWTGLIVISISTCFREAPLPFSCKSSGIQFTSTKDVSKIVVEKQDIVTKPGLTSPSSRGSLSHSLSSPTQGLGPPPSGNESTPKASQNSSQERKESPPGEVKSQKDTSSPKDVKPASEGSNTVINVSIQVRIFVRSKKYNVEFPLTRPTLFYGPDSTDFIGKFVYTEMKGQYRTVIPLSGDCKNAGHWTILMRLWKRLKINISTNVLMK